MAYAERGFTSLSAVSSMIGNVDGHGDGCLCITFQD